MRKKLILAHSMCGISRANSRTQCLISWLWQTVTFQPMRVRPGSKLSAPSAWSADCDCRLLFNQWESVLTAECVPQVFDQLIVTDSEFSTNESPSWQQNACPKFWSADCDRQWLFNQWQSALAAQCLPPYSAWSADCDRKWLFDQ